MVGKCKKSGLMNDNETVGGEVHFKLYDVSAVARYLSDTQEEK